MRNINTPWRKLRDRSEKRVRRTDPASRCRIVEDRDVTTLVAAPTLSAQVLDLTQMLRDLFPRPDKRYRWAHVDINEILIPKQPRAIDSDWDIEREISGTS